MAMPTVTAKIGDPVGLHLRAASRIVQRAKKFDSEIHIQYQGVVANAKSILGLASLVAHYLEPVQITAEGPDAQQALKSLARLIENELAEQD